MMLDSLLKKSFSGILLAFAAVMAYFHASIAMQFVAMTLLERSFPTAHTATLRKDTTPSERDPTLASAILERNPFDSATGALTTSPAAPKSASVVDDPLTAPLCEGIGASITTQSSDRSWSLASLQASGEAHPRMRRVGDVIGGKQVAFIGYNPREGSPAVWLTQDDELCQVVLFRAPALQGPEAPPLAMPGTSGVPPEIASRIRKVSDKEYQIDRQVVDRLLEDQAQFMKGVRLTPERKDGSPVGIRLFGIRPDSLLGMLGLQSGDRIDSINGYSIANPEKALEAYAHLRFASNLNLVLNRRGNALGLDYKIQ